MCRRKIYEQGSRRIRVTCPTYFYLLIFDSKNATISPFSILRNSSVHSSSIQRKSLLFIQPNGFSVSATPYMRASIAPVSKRFLSISCPLSFYFICQFPVPPSFPHPHILQRKTAVLHELRGNGDMNKFSRYALHRNGMGILWAWHGA